MSDYKHKSTKYTKKIKKKHHFVFFVLLYLLFPLVVKDKKNRLILNQIFSCHIFRLGDAEQRTNRRCNIG